MVRDEQGWPIPGARIETVELPAGQRVWAASFSDEQGRFRLAWRGPGALSVTASQRGFLEQSQVVASHEQPLEFTLRRAGTLAGSLLMDDGIPTNRIFLRVERDGLSKAGGLPGPDGGFSYGPLEPGEYILKAMLHQRELARVESISVQPDRKDHDPRLAPLDLRGLLAWFALKVLDKEGHPPIRVWVTEPGPAGPLVLFQGRPDPKGWIRFLAPSRSERFAAGAPGHRPVLFSRDDSGGTILLDQVQGEILIAVSLPRLPEALRRARHFHLRLLPARSGKSHAEEPRPSITVATWSEIDSQRPQPLVQKVLLPGPGSYRLSWHLYVLTEKGFTWIEVLQSPPSVIEVGETQSRQEFSVGLTLAQVEAALRNHEEP